MEKNAWVQAIPRGRCLLRPELNLPRFSVENDAGEAPSAHTAIAAAAFATEPRFGRKPIRAAMQNQTNPYQTDYPKSCHTSKFNHSLLNKPFFAKHEASQFALASCCAESYCVAMWF
jgi:hypothetical protein